MLSEMVELTKHTYIYTMPPMNKYKSFDCMPGYLFSTTETQNSKMVLVTFDVQCFNYFARLVDNVVLCRIVVFAFISYYSSMSANYCYLIASLSVTRYATFIERIATRKYV